MISNMLYLNYIFNVKNSIENEFEKKMFSTFKWRLIHIYVIIYYLVAFELRNHIF